MSKQEATISIDVYFTCVLMRFSVVPMIRCNLSRGRVVSFWPGHEVDLVAFSLNMNVGYGLNREAHRSFPVDFLLSLNCCELDNITFVEVYGYR
jgi:hypothetical protein